MHIYINMTFLAKTFIDSYGGPENTWCKYILTRYSDLLPRYGDLPKSP